MAQLSSFDQLLHLPPLLLDCSLSLSAVPSPSSVVPAPGTIPGLVQEVFDVSLPKLAGAPPVFGTATGTGLGDGMQCQPG